jgi:hypothetical protein
MHLPKVAHDCVSYIRVKVAAARAGVTVKSQLVSAAAERNPNRKTDFFDSIGQEQTGRPWI